MSDDKPSAQIVNLFEAFKAALVESSKPREKRPSARRKYEPPAVKQTISFDDIRAEFEKAQAEE